MTLRSMLAGLAATLLLGSWTCAVEAEQFRYRYVSLDEATLPEGVLFFDGLGLNNSGRIYGTAYACVTTECELLIPHIAVYVDGAVKVRQPGLAYAVNGGTVGGSVLVDPENFIEQAALFRGNSVELIPRLPEELSSFVTALNGTGSALVISFNAESRPTYVLYENGQSTVLDFGPEAVNVSQLAINNAGIISGTQGSSFCDGSTGFRFDPHIGTIRAARAPFD